MDMEVTRDRHRRRRIKEVEEEKGREGGVKEEVGGARASGGAAGASRCGCTITAVRSWRWPPVRRTR